MGWVRKASGYDLREGAVCLATIRKADVMFGTRKRGQEWVWAVGDRWGFAPTLAACKGALARAGVVGAKGAGTC